MHACVVCLCMRFTSLEAGVKRSMLPVGKLGWKLTRVYGC